MENKPSAIHRPIKLAALVLVALGWFFLLFTALSTPIIKSLHVFEIKAEGSILGQSGSGGVMIGAWGYCTHDTVVTIRIPIVGDREERTPGECSQKQLGIDLDNKVFDLLGLDNVDDLINTALTTALALHPLGCGLSFIALIALVLLFLNINPPRIWMWVSVIFTGLAMLVAWIAFAISYKIADYTQDKLSANNLLGSVSVSLGPVVWLSLIGAILLTLGFGTIMFWSTKFRKARKY